MFRCVSISLVQTCKGLTPTGFHWISTCQHKHEVEGWLCWWDKYDKGIRNQESFQLIVSHIASFEHVKAVCKFTTPKNYTKQSFSLTENAPPKIVQTS